MRWAGLCVDAVEYVVTHADDRESDEGGNPIVIGRVQGGRLVKVVIALDDPDFVITVITKE